MTKKIGVTITMLLATGAVGLTGLASASGSARETTSVKCSWACLDIYRPVTCEMSDGKVRRFSNRCQADLFACEYGLKIIRCHEGV